MSAPQYPKMRSSGIEWIGDVPQHWHLQPLLSVAGLRDEPNTGMKESNLLSLSYGRIVPKDIGANDGLLPESFETYQIVRPGDVVWRLTDLQNDKRSLRTAMVNEIGIITSAYLATTPKNISASYFSYLLRAYDVSKVFYSMGGGLRQSMKFDDVKRLPIIVPPASEQGTIATFLDRETTKIDALVEEQKRLIELLKEKRQAVISHAVTKGLNPNAPMKNSGVEWLGNVPEHWGVLTVRRVATRVQTGMTPSNDIPSAELDDGLPWYTPGDFRNSLRLTSSLKRLPPGILSSQEIRLFQPGSVLVVGIGATLGKVGYVDHLCSGNQQINAISPNASIQGHFLAYSLSAKAEIMGVLSNASTIGIMNQDRTKEIPLARPPLNEQLEITAFLDAAVCRIDALVTEAEAAISLLHERRSALIAAAVTGKIDVRGLVEAQASSPEVAAA